MDLKKDGGKGEECQGGQEWVERKYVCMYACMHVCIYVSMYVYVYVCMYVYVYVYVCIHIYVFRKDEQKEGKTAGRE